MGMYRLKIKSTIYGFRDVFADDPTEAKEGYLSTVGSNGPDLIPADLEDARHTWKTTVVSVEEL